MGLANEQRLLGAYQTIIKIHDEVDSSKLTTWNDYQDHAASIKELCDQLLGILITHTDYNSAQWFFGESEYGFKYLVTGFGFAAKNRAEAKLHEDYARDSKSEMGIGLFSSHMGFDRTIREIANWWELWTLVPWLIYYVKRESDKCFPVNFLENLNRLIAKIMLLRESINADQHEEKVLLWKFKLFEEDKRDWNEKVQWLRSMSQLELQTIVDTAKKKKDEEPDVTEDFVKLNDPIHGNAPSLESLVKQVVEKAKCDEKQAMQALSICNENVDEAVEFAITRFRASKPSAGKSKKGAKKR